jgi:hypothetical protein
MHRDIGVESVGVLSERGWVVTYDRAAPAAKWRRGIVPDPPPEQCSHGSDIDDTEPTRKNYTWAKLMVRTFEFDVLQCPRSRGRLKIIAALESPEVA